jgi:hypothetical protein
MKACRRRIKSRRRAARRGGDAKAPSRKSDKDKEKENGSTDGPDQIPRHFTIKASFLKERCYPYLMDTPLESLAYLSGVRCQETTVIDQLVTFKLDVQTEVYVRGNPMSVADALIAMDEQGDLLEGTIHCQPGEGPSATLPSGIDRKHHRRLESAGYRPLGIIMARDGHIRFYTDRMPFEVQVVGNDVVKLSDTSYRLMIDKVTVKTGPAEKAGETEKKTDEHDGQTDNKDATLRQSCGEANAGGVGTAGVPNGTAGEGAGVQAGSRR